MKKYIIGVILVALVTSIYYLPRKEVEVHVPIEDLGLYDDIGMMAMESGDYQRANKYFTKSGNDKLLTHSQNQLVLKQTVMEVIDRGLMIKHAKSDGSDVFKRLISVELLDDKIERNAKVVTLLLLAKLSCESGFKAWDSITKEALLLSSELESKDTELSSLLYELGQIKVEL